MADAEFCIFANVIDSQRISVYQRFKQFGDTFFCVSALHLLWGAESLVGE